jgi:hypothetical protein
MTTMIMNTIYEKEYFQPCERGVHSILYIKVKGEITQL